MRLVAGLAGGCCALGLTLLAANYPGIAPWWAHGLQGLLVAVIGFTFARAYGPRPS